MQNGYILTDRVKETSKWMALSAIEPYLHEHPNDYILVERKKHQVTVFGWIINPGDAIPSAFESRELPKEELQDCIQSQLDLMAEDEQYNLLQILARKYRPGITKIREVEEGTTVFTENWCLYNDIYAKWVNQIRLVRFFGLYAGYSEDSDTLFFWKY